MASKENGVMIIPDEIQTRRLDTWDVNVSGHPVVLDRAITEQERELVRALVTSATKENTWAQQALGVPSVIVRLDSTLVPDASGELTQRELYEGELRPGWLGYSSLVNAQFASAFEEINQTWPKGLTAVVTPESKTRDDQLWVPTTPTLETSAEHVLLRVDPGTPGAEALVNRSVSPVQTKHDKSYGVKMGLWDRVATEEDLDRLLDNDIDPEKFPNVKGPNIVFKPDGSKAAGVRAWIKPGQQIDLPDRRIYNRTNGARTRKNIEGTFAYYKDKGGMYAQPFHAPIPGMIGEKPVFVAHRTYWAVDASEGSTREYHPLGGVWMANNDLILHGGEKTVVGPLLLEK